MDSLAAAVEAGRVDLETCLLQLFASPSDTRDMRAVLHDEGRGLSLSERHRGALLNVLIVFIVMWLDNEEAVRRPWVAPQRAQTVPRDVVSVAATRLRARQSAEQGLLCCPQ